MIEFFSKEDIIENNMISVDIRNNTKDSPVHKHGFLEILYVCNGTAVHHYKGKEIHIEKGNFFFVDYNSEHSMTAKSADFEAITCTFVPEFIDSSLWGCESITDVFRNYSINLLPYPPVDFYSFNDDSGKVFEILNTMMDEYNSKHDGYLSYIKCCLIQLLLLAVRKFNTVTTELDERIEEIIDYVNNYYAEQITLEALCHNFYCSLSNISILFKAQTGITFTEYLRKTRINASCRLLTESKKSIWEVANAVGYNDVRTFRLHFKEHFKTTPLKFRKMWQLHKDNI